MMWASISSIAHAWWVVILESCKNCSLTSNAFTGGSHEYDIPIFHDSYDLSESTQVHGSFAVVVHLQLYETYAGLRGQIYMIKLHVHRRFDTMTCIQLLDLRNLYYVHVSEIWCYAYALLNHDMSPLGLARRCGSVAEPSRWLLGYLISQTNKHCEVVSSGLRDAISWAVYIVVNACI